MSKFRLPNSLILQKSEFRDKELSTLYSPIHLCMWRIDLSCHQLGFMNVYIGNLPTSLTQGGQSRKAA